VEVKKMNSISFVSTAQAGGRGTSAPALDLLLMERARQRKQLLEDLSKRFLEEGCSESFNRLYNQRLEKQEKKRFQPQDWDWRDKTYVSDYEDQLWTELDDYITHDETYFQYPHSRLREWLDEAERTYQRMARRGSAIDKPRTPTESECKMLWFLTRGRINLNDLNSKMSDVDRELRRFEIRRFYGRRTEKLIYLLSRLVQEKLN